MIDGIKPRKRTRLHPHDRHLADHMVVGGRMPDAVNQTQAAQAAKVAPSPQPPKPAFKTPQEVEATEEQSDTTSTGSILHKREAEKKRSFKLWLHTRTKKQWFVYISAAIIVLSGAGVSTYLALHKAPPASKTPVIAKQEPPPEPPKPVTVASSLTGLQVAPNINDRPVTGIMIENSPDARPQSSLDQAGVVFEAIAEGGITRFLALYQDTEPDYIGPVRSVRPYYVQWALGFDAPIAHVGGSPDGLAAIKSLGAKDLDQFAGGAYFYRITSRYAPHNVYTDFGKLRAYQSSKGFGKSNYTGFERKKDQAAAAPTATSIDLNISSSLYNPHFDYDATSNSYKRSLGGSPHMQLNKDGSQTQLIPHVVVVLVLPQGLSGKYTTYQTTGSGTAYVFQDGGVNQVTWKKDSAKSQFSFTDAAGKALQLNAGQTWLSAVGDSSRVTYH